jgi:integrase
MPDINFFKAELNKINTNKKIKIRLMKSAKQTRYSIYLDFINNNTRKTEYLKLFLNCTIQLSTQDKQTLKYAQEYRDQKEREFLKNQNDFQLVNFDNEINVFEFIEAFGQGKARLPTYLGLKNHLKKFHGDNLKFSDIDKSFCEGFRDYLDGVMGQMTVKTIFSAFKAVINKALKDEQIFKSPCKDIIIKAQSAKREFLFQDEIVKIVNFDTPYVDVKNAFLFSCFTGLRLSDIQKLTFEEVKDGYLYFRQRKTGDIDRMLLTSDANKIILQQRKLLKSSKLVFNSLLSKSQLTRKLQSIIIGCGITKKITFHCGRHTAATTWISAGVDIFTVQKLLGHRDIDATMIYAKLIDKKRDEYVQKMPELMK